MFLVLNKFKISIKFIKILLFFTNFNKNFSNIILNNFYKKILFLGFLKKNLILISFQGSLEINFILKLLFKKKFFDVFYILGIIIKNKTFHFEIISFNINFFLSKICLNYYIPLINSLIIFNKKYLILSKLFIINNFNLKIFIKYINILYFLR